MMRPVTKLTIALALILFAVYVRNAAHGVVILSLARVVLARALLVTILLVGKILHGDDGILSIFSD
jgi:hypothetical protein